MPMLMLENIAREYDVIIYWHIYDADYGWANSIGYQVKLIEEYGNPISNRGVLFSINGKSFKSMPNGEGIAGIIFSLESVHMILQSVICLCRHIINF